MSSHSHENESYPISHQITDLVLSPFLFAFHFRRRQDIKEKAAWICSDCKTDHSDDKRVVASHARHNRLDKEDYYREENGCVRCYKCETRFHLLHVQHPEEIDLDCSSNLRAIALNWPELNKIERAELLQEFGGIIDAIRATSLHGHYHLAPIPEEEQ
jgi:hypothetical protein